MTILLRRLLLIAGSWATLCAASGMVWAVYPERPVRLLVGFAPGGGTDLLARVVAQKLSERWGQPVLVENKEGTDGNIADDIVAKSAHDGYTLEIITPNHTVTPSLRKLNFDPIKDFAPVTIMVGSPEVLAAAKSLPANSVKELIGLAKSEPGQLNFDSTGFGGPPFMEMARLMSLTDTQLTHVPFKGTSAAMAALLGGEIQLIFQNVLSTKELVKEGRLKALAITGKDRSGAMPDVPTFAEAAGLHDFDIPMAWYGIATTGGTPRNVVDKLHDDIVAVMKLPDVQQKMAESGLVEILDTPDHLTDLMKNDIPRWASLLRRYNISPN